MKRGFFITLYGVNNIGKSTQAKLLVKRLISAGYDAVLLKYPIYDLEPTGPKLNSILRHHGVQKVSELELQSLFTQNRHDFEPKLREMMEEGKIIIAEDYVGTGIAWGNAKGVPLDEMETMNKGLLQEDLSILCIGKRHLRAKETNHIHETDDALVTRVGDTLDILAKKYGWVRFDMLSSIDKTSESLWNVVCDFLLAQRKNA